MKILRDVEKDIKVFYLNDCLFELNQEASCNFSP